ncbi:OmpA family protein [Arcicella rosea]|uniref:OmpA family protein n=1 Tax=Arcicella rosea TaxID=502909 RepID=UPI00345D7B9A
MINLNKIILTFCMVLLATACTIAQTLKDAEYHFKQMSYLNASELFEQVLKGKLSDADRQAAMIKLAYSYRQMRDSQNAERVYHELVSKGATFSGADTKVYLYYAQALASNGKYKEAQDVYEQYSKVEIADKRSGGFQKLYKNVDVLNRNATCYKVDYLSINTDHADFSPMYYKNGLVFNSSRVNEIGLKRMFSWDNSHFLDMYYLSDINQLTVTTPAGLGSSADDKLKIGKKGKAIGEDEYTAPTANDTRTIGTFSGSNIYRNFVETPGVKTESFSKSLNTKYHEGPMTFTSDGKRVIFTRNNYNNGKYKTSADKVNKLKIYTAEEKGGEWVNIKEIPFDNNDYSTGHPSLTKDNKLMYFVSDMPGGYGGTDIYVCEYNDGKFGKPINMGPTINTLGNEMFPFVDERANLYFSSDGHPGLGDLDIFYVKLSGTKVLSNVSNMGMPINSSKDDFGLITDGERKSGYFSSNRKRGGTDDDIYRFTRECDEKPECQELQVIVYDADSKMPLDNTDVAVVENGKTVMKKTDSNGSFRICIDLNKQFGFNASRDSYLPNSVSFTSTESNMLRALEIPLMRVLMSDSTDVAVSKNTSPCPATKIVKGRVTVNKDKSSLGGVKVTLTNECDGTIQTVVTGPNGRYQFEICEGCEYTIDASKDNFASKGNKIDKLGKDDPQEINSNLSMFEEGDVIAIDNIYYNYTKYNIRPDAAKELNKLLLLMRRYPNMRIEVRSHTDSRATTEFNQTLSENRSASVVQYLVKRGIAANRFETSGYGETQLLNECADGIECTEEQHQTNRRSEFKIIQLK